MAPLSLLTPGSAARGGGDSFALGPSPGRQQAWLQFSSPVFLSHLVMCASPSAPFLPLREYQLAGHGGGGNLVSRDGDRGF